MALYFIVGARSLNLKHHHEYGVTSKLRYFFSVLDPTRTTDYDSLSLHSSL